MRAKRSGLPDDARAERRFWKRVRLRNASLRLCHLRTSNRHGRVSRERLTDRLLAGDSENPCRRVALLRARRASR
jgi:hypothetical protein